MVVADILTIPQQHAHADTVTVFVHQFNGRALHAKLLLTWYGKHPLLHVGERWALSVKLKPVHGLKNPGAKDHAQWYLQQGIQATGYIVNEGSHRMGVLPGYRLARWRQHVIENIVHVVRNPDIAGMICALTVGYRGLLSASAWRVFQNTGTSHLISISGLHLGTVAWIVYSLCYWLWSVFRRGLQYVAASTVASVCAVLSSVLFCSVSGLGLPAQRACLMIVYFFVSQWLGRQSMGLQGLFFVFFIIVMFEPLSIGSASLWLSFGAVAWIMSLNQGRLRPLPCYQQWVTIQIGLALGLLPLTIYFFHQVSLLTIGSNALAIPWVTFIVLPLCLLGLCGYACHVPGAGEAFIVAGHAVKPLWLFLQTMSSCAYNVVHIGFTDQIVMYLVLLSMALLLLSRDFSLKVLGCLLLLPLLYPRLDRPHLGDARLTVLDVGQGLSAVVETHRHILLFDAGPKSYGGFDAGNAVVVPFLRYRHWSSVDMMMISHGDMDHRGGVTSVEDAFPVKAFFTSVPHLFDRYDASSCHAGQQWVWDGVFFNVLWPKQGESYQGNNSSCVLKVSDGAHAFLLTGDIEKPAELEVLSHHNVKADVIQAPHHGSQTSSSSAFVSAVHPLVVIYPVGFMNRYHFPDERVRKRYNTLNTKEFLTSRFGAVMVYLSRPTKVK